MVVLGGGRFLMREVPLCPCSADRSVSLAAGAVFDQRRGLRHSTGGAPLLLLFFITQLSDTKVLEP